MDYDEEDPWARISPANEKPESAGSINARDQPDQPEPSLTRINNDGDSNDNAAWDAHSDDDNDDYNNANGSSNGFIEASSRLSLSARALDDDSNAVVASNEDGEGDDDTFEDASQGITMPSTPTADLSASTSFLSPPATVKLQSGFLAPPDTTYQGGNTMDDFDDDDDGFGEASGAQQGPANDEEDDFGDFGDEAQAGTGLDDDDFGDFDEAGPSASAGPNVSGAPPSHSAPQPTASTSAQPTGLPTFGRIVAPPDYQAAFRAAPEGEDTLTTLQRIVNDFFDAAYPGVEDSLYSDKPVPDLTDLTVLDLMLGKKGESSMRDSYTRMMEEPIQSKPWDWKKSKVRLAAMREVGLPVNLDDVSIHTALFNLGDMLTSLP